MKADRSHESLNLAVTSGCPSAGEGSSALRVGSLHFQAITKNNYRFLYWSQQWRNKKAPKNLVLIKNDWEDELQILNFKKAITLRWGTKLPTVDLCSVKEIPNAYDGRLCQMLELSSFTTRWQRLHCLVLYRHLLTVSRRDRWDGKIMAKRGLGLLCEQ